MYEYKWSLYVYSVNRGSIKTAMKQLQWKLVPMEGPPDPDESDTEENFNQWIDEWNIRM